MKNFQDTQALLSQLIAFDSVSHRCVLPIASFLAERCQDLGFKVQLYPDSEDANKTNIVCQVGPHKEGGLVISGHM